MSKLSPALKSLIHATHARAGTTPAPYGIASVYRGIAADAKRLNVGTNAWLTASAAATFTLNSPQSLLELFRVAVASQSNDAALSTAELIREIGLKCIGLNGVPRTINTLGSFYDSLDPSLQTRLSERRPRRNLNKANIDTTVARGEALWKSIYLPYEGKLFDKLATYHPDLPVFIVQGEYGALFSDPSVETAAQGPEVGRVLMSILAIACLRAQTGVGPQVTSHIFGLRKAFEDGTAESEESVPGGKWLASDDGSIWLLNVIDEIVAEIGQSFAKAKL
ncbi:mitochondrial protein [Piedraia hortae CBS 480.64]|uniref:Mitochondrial protein n=1 Tax=Piedraia hortae CBS 480.64 TaxID=1314780 RepID=A0A6A7C0Y2_9PEZI|nr:mitochondrial protein [Piedraia hortae CBS 480.64]